VPERRLAPGACAALEIPRDGSIELVALAAGQAAEVAIHRTEDLRQRLSQLVTTLAEGIYQPRVGTRLWTQDYEPLMRVEAQTTDRHDLMLEACSPWLNKALFGDACTGSCWENFNGWASEAGLDEKWIPYPLGVFRQAGERDGRFELREASSAAGDSLTLRAEDDVTVVVSACPVSRAAAPPDTHTLELRWSDPDA
jgi:uncharacterized protein YcgI (DUF1989 family)